MAGTGRLATLAAAVLARAGHHFPDGAVLVALSGGADSAVCAWAAAEVGRGPVRAVFVDHGFTESAMLGDAAAAIAAELGLALEVVSVVVPDGPSPEAMARNARLGALESSVAGDELIATGHTRDDQAETVLGNLLRGSGPEGIAGIPAARGRWIRPLLGVSRSQTRELAGLLGLPYRDDPANRTLEARRNVLRRDVIPDLEARFNPQLREALARAASLAAADDRMLRRSARRIPIVAEPGVVKLPAPSLAASDEPIAARAVRRALRTARGPHAGAFWEVQKVLEVARGLSAGATLGEGLSVGREGPWVVLTRAAPAGYVTDPVPLPIPGSVDLSGLAIDCWIENGPPAPWPLGTKTVVVDADAVGDQTQVQPARSVDRIDIGTGSKAVTEAMAEAGIPARLRPGWPVVVAAGRPLWIPGARTAAWVWADASTKRYLWLTHEMEER